MFAINQCLLYGKLIPAEKHISDAKMFQKLSCSGGAPKVPVYGKEGEYGHNFYMMYLWRFWNKSVIVEAISGLGRSIRQNNVIVRFSERMYGHKFIKIVGT